MSVRLSVFTFVTKLRLTDTTVFYRRMIKVLVVFIIIKEKIRYFIRKRVFLYPKNVVFAFPFHDASFSSSFFVATSTSRRTSITKIIKVDNYCVFGSHTAQKIKFSIKDFISKCDKIRRISAFTGKILNRKPHFLCGYSSHVY